MRPDRLRQLRFEKSMTQTELADALNLSKAAISTYETGLRSPTDETLIKMAQFFGVSSDYLLGISNVCYVLKTHFSDDELATAEEVFHALLNQFPKF